MSRDHRRIFLLAAESTAGFRLHHADIWLLAQQAPERLVYIEGALHGAMYRNAAILGIGDHAIRLDVDVLLMSRAVRAFDDQVGGREAGVDVAFVDSERFENDVGVLGIQLRLQSFVLDHDVRGEERFAILVREENDWLREMPNLRLDEERLIVLEQRDDVTTTGGNVAVVHDREAGRVEIEADVRDASARDGRTNRPSVQHSGKAEIVDVLRGAGRFTDPVLACDAGADCGHSWCFLVIRIAKMIRGQFSVNRSPAFVPTAGLRVNARAETARARSDAVSTNAGSLVLTAWMRNAAISRTFAAMPQIPVHVVHPG